MNESILFIFLFIILAFCVVALLSVLSTKQASKTEISKITSINSEMIKKVKDQYINFLNAIRLKNNEILQTICTKEFYKTIELKKSFAEKVVCILNANVLQIIGNTIEIEFISRNINTEILQNKCIFIFDQKNVLLNYIE